MTKNERIARRLLKIKAEFHDSPTAGKLIAAWTTYLDEQYPGNPMNYEQIAREVVEAQWGWKPANKDDARFNRDVECVVAKLKEMIPVSKDLEAAVREAVKKIFVDYNIEYTLPNHSDFEQRKCKREIKDTILSNVAPLVADKDKRIKELEGGQKKLADFVREFIEENCWDICSEPDGGDIQDKAEKYGLIYEDKATQEDYDNGYSEYGDIGDPVYRFTDLLKESPDE